MSQQKNAQLVRAAFDAFAADDIDAVLRLCDESIEITQAADLLGLPRRLHGHAGVREALAVWPGQWNDYRAEVLSATELGDRVMVTQLSRGRGKQSGVDVEMVFTFLFTLRGGKIVRWQIFTREQEALEEAGRGRDGRA